jgi:hypothetical protein
MNVFVDGGCAFVVRFKVRMTAVDEFQLRRKHLSSTDLCFSLTCNDIKDMFH